jgi:hypothetical protein
MVVSHLYVGCTRSMRKRAKASGQSLEKSEECVRWLAKGIDLERVMRIFSRNEVWTTNDPHVVPKPLTIAVL